MSRHVPTVFDTSVNMQWDLFEVLLDKAPKESPLLLPRKNKSPATGGRISLPAPQKEEAPLPPGGGSQIRTVSYM